MVDKTVCQETLKALYMSPKGLERWFDRMERFCSKNGGVRYYGEVLEIVKEYRETLLTEQNQGKKDHAV